jgi:hypothetical protein
VRRAVDLAGASVVVLSCASSVERPWSSCPVLCAGLVYAAVMHTHSENLFLTADGIDTADGRTALTNWRLYSDALIIHRFGNDRTMTPAEVMISAQAIAAQWIKPRTFRTAQTFELSNGNCAPGGVTIVVRSTY